MGFSAVGNELIISEPFAIPYCRLLEPRIFPNRIVGPSTAINLVGLRAEIARQPTTRNPRFDAPLPF